MGPCGKSNRNTKEGSFCFLSTPPALQLALSLRLSIARGSVNCEAATVML